MSLAALRMLLAVTCSAVIAAAPDAFAQELIKNGDTLTGQLRLVREEHPNGTPINAFQIVSAPRKMPATDDFCDGPASTFHIVAIDSTKGDQLRALLGRTVSLKADELFCSHTAWHIGDAVVLKWSALAPR